MASWKELYAATVKETAPAELRTMIFQTESAIDARLYEITFESIATQELSELREACTVLKLLKQELEKWENYEAQ